MNRATRRIALAAALAAWSAVAQAAIIPWTATLSGLDEFPPVVTSGSGTASGTYDTVDNVLTWNIQFSNLSSGVIAAHFHGPLAASQAGLATAGVQVFRPTLPLGTASGQTSGSIVGSFDLDDLDLLTPPNNTPVDTLESQLLSELWYLNVHTSQNTGGEIRGQVRIPEPASLALFGLGLAGLAGLRRRRIA